MSSAVPTRNVRKYESGMPSWSDPTSSRRQGSSQVPYIEVSNHIKSNGVHPRLESTTPIPVDAASKYHSGQCSDTRRPDSGPNPSYHTQTKTRGLLCMCPSTFAHPPLSRDTSVKPHGPYRVLQSASRICVKARGFKPLLSQAHHLPPLPRIEATQSVVSSDLNA